MGSGYVQDTRYNIELFPVKSNPSTKIVLHNFHPLAWAKGYNLSLTFGSR